MEEDGKPLKDISFGEDTDPRRAVYAAQKAIGEQSALDERLRHETVEAFSESAQLMGTSQNAGDALINAVDSAMYVGEVNSKDNIDSNKSIMRSYTKSVLRFNKVAGILVFIFVLLCTAYYSYMHYING